jgi:hypothetical protein
MLTDNGNHQLSSKTTRSPEANQTMNIQHIAMPIPLYGSKTWTLKEQDTSRITAADEIF